MIFKVPLKNLCIAFLSTIIFSGFSAGQSYSFRNYNSEYGIPNSFIYTINQSDNGFLWVGTGKGLARFDGYNYFRVAYPDSAGNKNPNRNPTASFKDADGTIWFGFSDGSIFLAKENSLETAGIANSKSITTILRGSGNLIYVIPQSGAIFSINPVNSEVKEYLMPSEYNMFSAAFSENGTLLIGTMGAVLQCKIEPDTIRIDDVIDEFDYYNVRAISRVSGDRFVVGTEDNGLFSLEITEKGHTLERFSDHPEWSELNVRAVFTDDENNIWVSTIGNGVIQFQPSEDSKTGPVHQYNTSTGLPSDDVWLVFEDLEGNYWFGLFGEGLSMLASYAFEYFIPGKNSGENNILYAAGYNENFLLGASSGFHIYDIENGRSLSFTDLTRKTGGVNILSYFLDDQKILWIGSDGKGLFTGEPGGSIRLFYRSGDSGADRINDIQMDEKNIWLATTSGVIVLDRRSGARKAAFNTNEGLPMSNINKIIIDNGNAYIGTMSDRLYMIDRNFKISAPGCTMTGNTINKIVGFSKKGDGTIWTATYGNGIFACKADSVLPINYSDGLFSNYCYGIFTDSKSNIWIGHSKGISKMENRTRNIRTYGSEYVNGGNCNPGGMYESPDGRIFVGTTEGLIVYDGGKEAKRNLPPFNNITSVVINDSVYHYRPVISLPFGKYRVVINYSGVNFSDPSKVYYQTYMENFNLEWNKPALSREATYMLSDGKYKFNLLSLDENGHPSEPVVTMSIIVAKPLYKKWWFILLTVLVLAAVVFIIIRQRDKAQKKVRDYLEDELAKRTNLIVKQKTEIELQNIEITDSINYAKRIQTSILPDINKLRESFRDAFILFHPRDIVSGDFYWFDKIDDEKFILVCADSTGHGVPGAFMSMIGSTLLQDIVSRKKITRPSQILGLLDKQIFSTLNQNHEYGVSNDGMDMVICEVNLKTRHIRFASAMRPIIIVLSGEPLYIRGNRSSVGGEAAVDKYYDDQEYYMNQGDTLYLFSDGFPDQFGGSDGKKMKIARLKKLLEQINALPMKEQEISISKFWSDWKGSFEQVDDVLLIGVRV